MIVLLLIVTMVISKDISAQTKEDIFNTSSQITWLGLDFSNVKMLGTASQFGNAGEISNEQFKGKFIPEWNQLFVNEPKKFDVASAVHRIQVRMEMDVTSRVNQSLNNDFFTNKPEELNSLDPKKIEKLVDRYSFDNLEGIGLVFFVEGMNKPNGELTSWVTFVNMKTKQVLLTRKVAGKIGGIGFRNFWAKGFFTILKDMKSDFYSWKR